MKAVPQNQSHSQDAARVPGWLRDPKAPHTDRDRQKLKDAPRVSTVHEDVGDDEPGYGHGV